MKKIVCLIIVLLSAFVFASCRIQLYEYKKPSSQPNTKWVSEDGIIEFYVREDGYAIGTILVDEGSVDILLCCGIYNDMAIYPIEALEDGDRISSENMCVECWSCSYKSMDKFIAKVQWGKYSEVGEKIVFHKVT